MSVCAADAAGNAGRIRQAEGGHAGTGFDQQRVRRAVVAALELDDLVAPREAARQAQGVHAGFRAGGNKAQPFHGRERFAHQRAQARFQFGRRA